MGRYFPTLEEILKDPSENMVEIEPYRPWVDRDVEIKVAKPVEPEPEDEIQAIFDEASNYRGIASS